MINPLRTAQSSSRRIFSPAGGIAQIASLILVFSGCSSVFSQEPVYQAPSGRWLEARWYEESCEPADFFREPTLIKVCIRISKKNGKPSDLIDGLEDTQLNTVGNHGITLLHWAYFKNNLKAFEKLLEAGITPDKEISETIIRKKLKPMQIGDNILETCARDGAWPFLNVALKTTKDKELLSSAGETLLVLATTQKVIFSLDQETIQTMIDNKIPLDTRSKYGSTPAYRALSWNRPEITLQLLKAGASPDIATHQNDTIKKRLALIQGHEHQYGSERFSGLLSDLQQWLDSHSSKTEQTPPVTQD